LRRLERETYRQASHATWEAMAPGWKRWRAQLEEDAAPVREWMVHALAAEPGNTVLAFGRRRGHRVRSRGDPRERRSRAWPSTPSRAEPKRRRAHL